MMKNYEVWAQIEEIDPASWKVKDIELPAKIGEFATLEEAKAFVRTLLVPSWDQEAPEAQM